MLKAPVGKNIDKNFFDEWTIIRQIHQYFSLSKFYGIWYSINLSHSFTDTLLDLTDI